MIVLVPPWLAELAKEIGEPLPSNAVVWPGPVPDMAPCEFCGYEYPERLGRYGCPNCHGEGL